VHPQPNPPGTRVEPARIAPGPAALQPDLEELYVGYLPVAPPRTARFMRGVVPSLVVGAAAFAAILAALQGRVDPGVFEYGRTRTIEGTLYELPYPLVIHGGAVGPRDRSARDGNASGSGAEATRHAAGDDQRARGALLVRQGKHGAAADAAGLDGRRVRLDATRIESPLGSMLELVPGSLQAVGGPALDSLQRGEAPAVAPVRIEVTGEIVDSKCFLGVMKPGRGKPHRACAARCLSGGIPPQLLVEASGGSRRLLVLADADGAALAPARFLDLVSEPVVATGLVERRAGLLVLRVDEGGLRRAGGAGH
jgi:hypothetical protein